MGQELQRRAPGTVARQSDPSWPTVARTTARLWLDRHHPGRAGRRRLVLLISALLAIASFGSGAERVDVRYIAPDGSKAFEAGLAAYRKNRIAAGRQLLTNKHVQATASAGQQLAAGQVDPRLLVTLSTLADLMP